MLFANFYIQFIQSLNKIGNLHTFIFKNNENLLIKKVQQIFNIMKIVKIDNYNYKYKIIKRYPTLKI